jgi:RimJ/RimL family protein N-acetyltransferase
MNTPLNHILTFKQATPADIPLIQSLAHRIWHAYYPNIISVAQIEYMLQRMYGEEIITQELADPNLRYDLLLLNNEPIGYASYCFEPPCVFLSKLYITPETHGNGIGQRALARIEEFAQTQRATSIYLFVNKRNEKAIRAYLRFGFVIEEAVVKDIGGGFVMDDYKMRKHLTHD